jgi:hypothetical protein
VCLYRVAVNDRHPEEVRNYVTTHAHVAGLVRDPAARHFAVLGSQVEIWDVERNEVLHVLPAADRDTLAQAAFSPNGDQIYVYGTVPGAVVRYRVATAEETGRWTAPYRTGGQVLVTPDERFLVAVGPSLKGVHVHDLARDVRITHDRREWQTFDQDNLCGPWATWHDSSQLMYLLGALYRFGLPDFVDETVRVELVEPFSRCAASATEAPVVAFGSWEDATVRWFVRAVPTHPSASPNCPD